VKNRTFQFCGARRGSKILNFNSRNHGRILLVNFHQYRYATGQWIFKVRKRFPKCSFSVFCTKGQKIQVFFTPRIFWQHKKWSRMTALNICIKNPCSKSLFRRRLSVFFLRPRLAENTKVHKKIFLTSQPSKLRPDSCFSLWITYVYVIFSSRTHGGHTLSRWTTRGPFIVHPFFRGRNLSQ